MPDPCRETSGCQPSPSRLDDPSDPLWLYAAEPVVPEIAELIAATWREVAHFEALIVAALSDPASSAFCPERKEAAAFARAVEDLAVLLCQPVAADGGRALMDGRGSEAFPCALDAFAGWRAGRRPWRFYLWPSGRRRSPRLRNYCGRHAV